jgi:hypothetical protein
MALSIKEVTQHVVCKYTLLVLVFSFFSAVLVGWVEPTIKKLVKVGEPEEHEIKKKDILMKGLTFIVGLGFLFALFGDKFIECASGI